LGFPAISPAESGLVLSYAFTLMSVFQYGIRVSTEAETQTTSVERITHYHSGVPSEAEPLLQIRPNPDWPANGKIEFKQVNFKFQPHLDYVLKDLNFVVNAGEKIGIVGRTGAGKSSLILALYRIIELEPTNQILIDGIDIATIGLEDLRKSLAIIPQEPRLFPGTLRSNLDPFNACTDEQIWEALDKVHLSDRIKTKFARQLLNAPIQKDEDFSVGQRQLFCVARALLRKSKIVLLDEATAAMDAETDRQIQLVLRDCFKDCTLLSIAHRIQTIIDADRVLVMDKGRIIEFDSPSNLLHDRNSAFSHLVDETGKKRAKVIRDHVLKIKPSQQMQNLITLDIDTEEPLVNLKD